MLLLLKLLFFWPTSTKPHHDHDHHHQQHHHFIRSVTKTQYSATQKDGRWTRHTRLREAVTVVLVQKIVLKIQSIIRSVMPACVDEAST